MCVLATLVIRVVIGHIPYQMALDPLDTFPLLARELDAGLGLLIKSLGRRTDHVTNELLPNPPVFVVKGASALK